MVTHKDLKVVTKRAPTPKELDDCCSPSPSQAREVERHRLRQGRRHGRRRRGTDEPPRQLRIAAIARRAGSGEAAGLKISPAVGSVVARTPSSPSPTACWPPPRRRHAIIQPGGSMRDEEVIAAADEKGLGHGLHRDAPLPALILAQESGEHAPWLGAGDGDVGICPHRFRRPALQLSLIGTGAAPRS
jgi:hypothetical protein